MIMSKNRKNHQLEIVQINEYDYIDDFGFENYYSEANYNNFYLSLEDISQPNEI